jgi:hypothetical protein
MFEFGLVRGGMLIFLGGLFLQLLTSFLCGLNGCNDGCTDGCIDGCIDGVDLCGAGGLVLHDDA